MYRRCKSPVFLVALSLLAEGGCFGTDQWVASDAEIAVACSCAGKKCGDINACGQPCLVKTCGIGSRCMALDNGVECVCSKDTDCKGCCIGPVCLQSEMMTAKLCGNGSMGDTCRACKTSTDCTNYACANGACTADTISKLQQACTINATQGLCFKGDCCTGCYSEKEGKCIDLEKMSVDHCDPHVSDKKKKGHCTECWNTSCKKSLCNKKTGCDVSTSSKDNKKDWVPCATGNCFGGACLGRWKVISTGVKSNLNAVWASSQTDAYAVGDEGTVLHWDGSKINDISAKVKSLVTIKSSPAHLRSVWGTGKNEVFIAGDSGIVIKYNGVSSSGAWKSISSGVPIRNLKAIWGSGGQSIYVTGEMYSVNATATVMRYNGSTWIPEHEKYNIPAYPYRRIWGDSASNVFMLASSSPSLAHFNGTGWTKRTVSTLPTVVLNDIWGTGASSLYLVGNANTILTYNYKNDVKKKLDSKQSLTYDFNGIWGTKDGNLFIVGSKGLILHYDGHTTWSRQGEKSGLPSSISLTAVSGTSKGGAIFVVGEKGTFVYYDPSGT